MPYVCSALGDGYTRSMQAVSSARDVHNSERVSQSVMHYSLVMRFHQNIVVLAKDITSLKCYVETPEPRDPMSCSDHSVMVVSGLTLSSKPNRGQRKVPSAKVFCAPGIHFSVRFRPPMSSKRPSILMSKHALVSLAPQHREIHDTTAMSSPLVSIGSTAASSLCPTNSSMTHAVTTISSDSNRLIVMVQVSPSSAFLLSSVVSSCGRSYLQNAFLSTQKPLTASKLASDK